MVKRNAALLVPETDAERMLLAGQDRRGAGFAELPEADDEPKRVRAAFLRGLILSLDNGALEAGGLWIDGPLDLADLTVKVRLSFHACRFAEINLEGATFPALALRSCDIRRIYGSFLKCTGNFDLWSATVHSGVNLPSAEIGGKLNFSAGTFHGKDWLLLLDGARIGELDLRHVEKADRISLLGARARVLYDDYASWSTGAPGQNFHQLDGFRYDTFGNDYLGQPTPVDASGRIAWLKKQFLPDNKFRPQPWNWLAQVLADMGHVDDARAVSKAKFDEQLRTRSVTGPTALALRAYGALYGYGYLPLRLLTWVAGIWFLASLLYLAAADANLMRPTDGNILASKKSVCAARWTDCAPLAEVYPRFNAFAYSLDVILPISGLQQAKSWTPSTTVPASTAYSVLGVVTAALTVFERLFGWLAGLMLVSVASGLVKRR